MENNFYQPKLNEFHEGFLYQEKLSDGIWIDKVFEVEYGCPPIEYTRVKRIDQQDIESLGWKYDNNAEPIPSRETYELPLAFTIDTQRENDKCWILYLFSDGTVWIEYIFKCGGEGYVFKGTIKNKSQLKQVMEMIGINLKHE